MSLIMVCITTGFLLTLGIAIRVHQDARAVAARHPIFQVVYYTWNFLNEASFVALKMTLRASFVMLKIGIRVFNILADLLTRQATKDAQAARQTALDAQEARNLQAALDAQAAQEARDAQAARDLQAVLDAQAAQDARDAQEARDLQAALDAQTAQDARDAQAAEIVASDNGNGFTS